MTKQELAKLLDGKLKGVATKADIAEIRTEMATKADLATLEKRLTSVEKQMATKKDLAELQSGISHVLVKRIIPQLDKLYTQVEDVRDTVGRIDRQLRAVVDRQDRQDEALEKHDEKLADHEQRLNVLEAPLSA